MLVLASLAIVSFLALVILTFTRSENRSSRTASELVRVRMLSELPEKLVISQIRRATKGLGSGYTWTSQPGMIRVFGTNPSDTSPRATPEELFKLYSAKLLTLPGAQASELQADIEAFSSADWGGKANITQALYADLNEPVIVLPPLQQGQVQRTESKAVYPIFDPSAIGVIDGVDYDIDKMTNGRVNAHPYPMPVLWLYVLRDGTIVAPTEKDEESVTITGATTDNPIVGRIAYWTDDESCKLNINTATEPAPWQAPNTRTTADEAAANSIPAKGEFYRMAGHPAYTSLAPALRNLGKEPGTSTDNVVREPQVPDADTAWWSHLRDWHEMLPRTFLRQDTGSGLGSEGGTLEPASEVLTKQERLFTTVDEMFYRSDRGANGAADGTGGTAPLLTQEGLRAARFVLTTHSRAPELNPFNRPKISLWPVQENEAKRNAVDKAFVAASTVGDTPYYLQRASDWTAANPGSSQQQDADMQVVSNTNLFQYMLRLTSSDIPGFGHRFVNTEQAADGKYSIASGDQLITSMFDMIRWGINPATPYNQQIEVPLTPQYSYLAPGYGEPGTNQGIGGWSAIPLRVKGVGETVEARLLPQGTADNQWARGYGRFPTITDAAIVFAPAEVELVGNQPVWAPPPNANFSARTKAIQAFLLIQPYVPAVGGPPLAPVFQYRIIGLDQWKVDDKPLNLPANATNVVSMSPARPFAVGPNKPMGGGHAAHTGLAAQFMKADGTPKTPGINDEEAEFAFVSSAPVPLDLGKGVIGTTLMFKGGPITIQINDNTTGAPSQIIELNFPDTEIPVPLLTKGDASKLVNVSLANQMIRRFTPTPGDTATSPPRMGDLFWGGDVIRGVGLHGEPFRTYPPPVGGGVAQAPVPSITLGDVRLLAGRTSAPYLVNPTGPPLPSFFAPHPLYFEAKSSNPLAPVYATFVAASGRDGAHMREMMFPPFTTAQAAGPLIARLNNNVRQSIAPHTDSVPAVPMGTMGAFNLDGRPGDFDTGPGIIEDGPYINAPDFNNIANELADESGWFKRGGEFTEENGITFSPWRQSASGVMFGSLPTGVYGIADDPRPRPWQTLLLCPNPPSRATQATRNGEEPGWVPGTDANAKKDHFGFATPRDHLWLEFFRMPAIEPAGFADNVSTEGKVNMNYQLMPFTWIKRATAMMGALHGVRITAIPTAAVTANSGPQHYKNPETTAGTATAASNLQFRYSVDADKTLVAFEDRFNGNEATSAAPDVFRSPSEICEMFLVPKRLPGHTYSSGNVAPQDPATTISTYKNTLDWWEGASDTDPADGFEATGDNLRESPYAQLYPRLCTRSNVFTVHYRVQMLNKSRSTAPNEWREGKDTVVADYRGQTTIERYLDQSDPTTTANLPDFVTLPAPARALDDYYRIRVVNRRVFAP